MFHKELSPRNLERSLSAPASGTSFGRLLLEDRHILTGALIQRKLEAVEAMPVDVKKKKKDGFNIKEKLSNFTLGLRGKLFGKRVQSIVESHGSEYGPILRDIRSGPTVFMKYGERHVSLLYTFLSILLNDLCFSIMLHIWLLSNHRSFFYTLGELN